MPTSKKPAVKKPTVAKKVAKPASATSKKSTAPAAKKAAHEKKTPAKKVEKTSVAALEVVEAKAAEAAKGGSFIPAVGRRKTAIARVRLIKNGKGIITVNGKPYDEYFTVYELRNAITSPLETVGQADAVDVSAFVAGGGIHGQAEAIRHGISRALIVLNPTFRKSLKKLGYLTRDARKKERKKFGLKRARRAPQWSKR
jgi:small subunit ribosomal protein S9